MTDVYSWGDSDPFEEDDSWMSEPESVCNNWRGWKKAPSGGSPAGAAGTSSGGAAHHNSGLAAFGRPSTSAGTSGGLVGYVSAGAAAAVALNRAIGGGGGGGNIVGPQSMAEQLAAAVATASASAAAAASSFAEIVNSPANGAGAGGGVPVGASAGHQGGGHPLHQQHHLFNPHRPSSPTYEILNSSLRASGSAVSSLTELSSRVVATYIPFEVVQRYQPPVPEQLQLRIAFWSFPDNEEDIRLYSCLANGSADEFQKGENFYRSRTVQNLLQIGFHLSATVVTSQTLKPCTVAVAFDRGRITSCSCTCVCSSSWCSHVVAVCLHRIFQPTTVSLRAPITESLSRLNQTQLQKFAQYLINEFPQQILPTAQRLLDELLNLDSAINSVWGAPDPTAGALIHDQTKWCLDEHQLHDNIRKILIKLCIPSPMVYSDVNYLSSTQPPAASEWTSLLRPLRGREPEGLWNLLSIVREMLRRHDRNYIPLLKILTEEILACGPILLWWFNTNVSLHRGYPPSSLGGGGGGNGGGGGGGGNGNNNNNRSSIHSNNHTSQHACSSLCDEIVVLWRLVTLNPALSAQDTAFLFEQLREYHLQTLEMVISASNSGVSGARHQNGSHQQQQQQNGSIVKTADIEIFGGFKPAMISCLIDWTTYPISGVTNAHRNPYCPSINAASTNTSSVNHAISGTVKMTPWSSKLTAGAAGSGSFSKQSSTESSANGGGEEEGSGTGAEIVNRRLNDSEDSGNNDNWDRVSSASGGSDEVLNRARPRAEGSIPIAQADAAAAAAVAGPSNADADYQIYVYSTAGQNVKSALSGSGRGGGGDSMKNYDPELLAAATVKPIEDSFEILFSRAEALYAHGYVKEACQLSVRLAEELLNRPPVLTLENGGGSGDQQQLASTSSGRTASTSSNGSGMNMLNGRSHVKRAPRNRFNPALHQISLLASATLSKAAFLCSVLSEHEDSHLLAFYVGLLGLELVRPPASTKALEVKLANQEQELVNSLKRIPLCTRALAVLREKGEQLRDGRLTSRGEALLPLILAGYIFDALVLSTGQGPVSAAYELSTVHTSFLPTAIRLPTDERLAFEASVAAIGLKANVSEADHPLLCEGTRRQRGDLALTLLVYYKDSKDRLNKIMDKLLDKEIHMINRRSQSNSGGGGGGGSSFSNHNHNNNYMLNEVANTLTKLPSTQYHSGGEVLSSHSSPSRSVQQCPNYQALETNALAAAASTSEAAQQQQQQQQATASTSTSNWDEGIKSWDAKFRRLSLNEGSTASTSQPVNVVSSAVNGSSKVAPNTDHSSTAATGTATSSSVDSSSPPETASSDNSPTVSRRSLFQASSSSKQQQSASDSSSSGESSDSFSSSSSTEKKCSPIHRSNLVAGSSSSSTPHHHLSPHHSISSSSVGSGLLQGAASTSAEMTYSDHHLSGTPPTIVDLTNGQSRGSTFESFNAAYMAPNGWNGTPAATVTNSPAPTANSCGNSYSRQSMSTGSLVGGAMPKNNNNSGSTYLQGSSHISHLKPHMRYKGKRGHYPIIPNQPSEASAHFMFELAKTVLAKAGGNNTSVLFTQPPSSSNGRAHRNLHMCAFQIGLYALGLHNAVSPNWLSRTYSSQVSWITAQAMEIGHQAIAFLIDTWEGHFTPNEVASLADRASRGQEQSMVSAAAQLALSCLPHSHALTPSEIQRALIQCKEQSTEMLERACLAVESAAQGGGVNPDVLFHVAHKWHELYDQEAIKARHQGRFEGGRTTQRDGSASSASSSSSSMARASALSSVQQLPAGSEQSASGEVDMAMGGTGSGHDGAMMMPVELSPFLYHDSALYMGDNAYLADSANASDMMAVSTNGHHHHHQQSPMYQPAYHHHLQASAPYHQANSQFNGNMNSSRYYQGAMITAMPHQQPLSNGRYCSTTPPYAYQTGPPIGTPSQQAPPQTQTPTVVPLSFSPFTPNFYQLTPLSGGGGGSGKQPLMAAPPRVPPPFFGYPHAQMNGGAALQMGPGSVQLQQQQQLPQQMMGGPNSGRAGPTAAAAYMINGGPPCSVAPTMMYGGAVMGPFPYFGPYPNSGGPMSGGAAVPYLTGGHLHHGGAHHSGGMVHHPSVTVHAVPAPTSTSSFSHCNLTPRQLSYLHSVYRVGMLAMETLARRVNDDRPQTKYAKNPTYCEDVKWLLVVAKKLGTSFVQDFCAYSANAIGSPFVLLEIINEVYASFEHSTQSGPNGSSSLQPYMASIRSHMLNQLIQKCRQLFTECIYFQLQHITSGEYEEFISTIRSARTVYHMLPDGNRSFNELIHRLKDQNKSKANKKDLWTHIMAIVTNSCQ